MKLENECMSIYQSKLHTLDGQVSEMELGLEQAFNMVHQGEVEIILAKIQSEKTVAHWWGEHESLRINDHEHHPGIATSGMTLGKLQRVDEEGYSDKAEEYFSLANIVNEGLRTTEYFKFFERELKIKPVSLDDGRELLIASQREYPPSEETHFSFAPHSDSIAFARAKKSWPISKKYRQTASFITVQNASNSAGFVMWDYAPKSRVELDEFYCLYDENNEKGLDFLNQYKKVEIHPLPGELCIFNCKNMHGVQTCNTLRRTIGSFFIQKNGGWQIFD